MEFFDKHKKVILIIVSVICLLLTGLTLLYKNNATFAENILSYVIIPVQKVIGSSGNWVSQRIDFFSNMNNLYIENLELKNKIAELETNNKRLQLYEKENARLAELLTVDQKYPDYPKVAAEIIANDPGNWYNVFIIDKGSNQGIENDMVVLAPGGVVGKIFETGDVFSKVISIIDDRSSVSVKSVRTEDLGILKGDYTLNGLCKMESININAEIIEGDEIITSPLSDIFPPGLAIGIVKEVKLDTNGLTKYALVEPHVSFRNLTNVLIINKRYKNLFLEE